MVKSYKEYIKEHFGAITIEYPPEHMFVRNPSVPTPLSINTHVGGIGRMPMHWNNSPYLSGGFGGAGGGRSGQDPTGEEDINNDKRNEISDLQSDRALDYMVEKFTSIEKSLGETEYENICMSMLNDIDSGNLNLEEDDIDGTINDKILEIGVEIFYDTINTPTEGDPGDYYNPPDGGDSGEYTSEIVGPINSENSKTFNTIFRINSTNDLPSLDEIVVNYTKNKISISAAILKTGLSKHGILDILDAQVNYIGRRLESKYENLDEGYFEGNGYYEDHEDIYEQFDELNLGILLYLTMLCKNSLNNNTADTSKKIREINNKYKDVSYFKRKDKIEDVNRILSMVINIPEKLK